MYKSITAILVFFTLSAANAAEYGATNWSYIGETAPEHWSNLDEKFSACAGHNQSPINISHAVSAELKPLQFKYDAKVQNVLMSDHTLQVNFNTGATLDLDGQLFELKQFHIHTPSENTLLGKQYPLELHLVHANAAGELAVVALMYEQGSQNKALKSLLALSGQSTNTVSDAQFQLEAFMPKHLDYYRFNGSLTTPPCTEGVRWVVLKEIQQASKAQLKAFQQLFQHGNNRPVQPQHARLVLH